MRILIGMLAHQLNSETLRRVHTQLWGHHGGYTVMVLWGDDIRPTETRFQAVTRKYQDLQRIFLSGPWDALLTVEQDMLPPPDALQRLARLVRDGADVAYGLYVWRYAAYHLWSAHPRLRLGDDGLFRFTSVSDHPDKAMQLWGQPLQVEGLGLGCTLLARQTLTRLPFRQRSSEHSCDTALALDCQDEGLIQIADLGCVCGHRLDETRIIWPDPTTATRYRIEEGI